MSERRFRSGRDFSPARTPERRLEPNSLDLHGCRAEDVRAQVEQFLDKYIVTGGTVKIIYGHGTGAVRREVERYLRELESGRGAFVIQSFSMQDTHCSVDLE